MSSLLTHQVTDQPAIRFRTENYLWPRNPTSGYASKQNETSMLKNAHVPPALLTIAEIWNQPECAYMDAQKRKRLCMNTIEYRSTLKGRKPCHLQGWGPALEDTALNEVGQACTSWPHLHTESNSWSRAEERWLLWGRRRARGPMGPSQCKRF